MRSKILGILVLVLMIANLYMIFVFAPNEATMGVIQRIFYFHLPFGVSSYISAYLLGFASIMYLIKHDFKWDRLADSAGEMGILFTSLSIMSGALWAKPVWGIWWTWDARLTLQFLLGLIFLSYLMLRAYLPEREKKAALGGVFGVLAMVDVPFNYLSIRWWDPASPTRHPWRRSGLGYVESDDRFILRLRRFIRLPARPAHGHRPSRRRSRVPRTRDTGP